MLMALEGGWMRWRLLYLLLYRPAAYKEALHVHASPSQPA
jgi:hypothetical protein